MLMEFKTLQEFGVSAMTLVNKKQYHTKVYDLISNRIQFYGYKAKNKAIPINRN